jgi:hypothetical protein
LEQNAASFDELLMRPGLRWNVKCLSESLITRRSWRVPMLPLCVNVQGFIYYV